jgi:peroxiredoxin Q/BCP
VLCAGARRELPHRYRAGMDEGDLAPDFSLPDETGTLRKLSDFLQSGPIVLFFYPGAMTKGCTVESCHFRDLASEFAALGAQRIGISHDPVTKQAQFSALHGFNYPLLSDPDGTVAEQFGVKRALGPVRRRTFVIAPDQRVLAIIKSEIRMSVHADRALAVLAAATPAA